MIKRNIAFFASAIFFVLILPLAAGFLLWGNFETIVDFFSYNTPHPYVGMTIALASSWLTASFVYFAQNRPIRTKINRYARAEIRLMELGKISKESILEYHSHFSWGAYASLGFSTVFIVASLLLQGPFEYHIRGIEPSTDQAASVREVIVFVSLALSLISAIIFATVDIVHTNSLSPLLPAGKRFDMVNKTILFAGAAFMIQIAAVNIFITLMSTWLSIIGATLSIVIYLILMRSRNIKLQALIEEFELNETEAAYISGGK